MKTIASVFYLPLETKVPFQPIGGAGWNYTIAIPAVPRGEVKIVKIPDFIENNYLMEGKHSLDTSAVTAPQVAESTIKIWQDPGWPGAPGGPGVCVCKGDEPTAEEIAAITARQELYCDWLINQAQNKWVAGQRDKVLEEERQAARWMGKEDFEWIKPMRAATLIPCPNCATQIQSGVMQCPACGGIVDFDQYTAYIRKQKAAEAAALGTVPAPVIPAPAPVAVPTYDGKALDLTADEVPIPIPVIKPPVKPPFQQPARR